MSCVSAPRQWLRAPGSDHLKPLFPLLMEGVTLLIPLVMEEYSQTHQVRNLICSHDALARALLVLL